MVVGDVVDGRRGGRRQCSSIRRRFEVLMVFKGVSNDDLCECRWRKTVGKPVVFGGRGGRIKDRRCGDVVVIIIAINVDYS